MTKDLFAERAADWDRAGDRVDNVKNTAAAIRDRVPFEPTMEIMDFGSGTGLLLERIASLVRKICAIDTSPAMNADLEAEDGSFHPDNTGVHHFGFDRDALVAMTRDAGFRAIEVSTASVLRKPHGDFPVFLLTATR